MTETRPTTHDVASPAKARLITGPLARVLAASIGALSSFYLLLSVIPMLATSAGSDGSAGIVTGALMFGGVAAEAASPRLMARLGVRRVLAIGLALLGVPALALIGAHQLAAVIAVCLVRGIGFGLTVVATGSLVVSLVPRERRGEGLGLFGIVVSVPGIVALPSGVWLAANAGYPLVFALAAGTALAGLAAQAGARRTSGSSVPEPDHSARLHDGLRSAGLMRPALVFAATTIAAGIVVAFLPLPAVSGGTGAAALLVQAVTAAIGRWAAGRYGDRKGHSRLLIPGLVTAAAGMTLLSSAGNPVGLMLGTALFGLGFGTVQSVTLAMMLERVASSGYGMVNALWNLAYDLGYGAGPVVFGAFVGHTGYSAGFALVGAFMATALVPALLDRPRKRVGALRACALATA